MATHVAQADNLSTNNIFSLITSQTHTNYLIRQWASRASHKPNIVMAILISNFTIGEIEDTGA